MVSVKIITTKRKHLEDWLRLRLKLWPECRRTESKQEMLDMLGNPKCRAFVAVTDIGDTAGFIELSLRDYVDGCTSGPVAHVEGIYVRKKYRNHGIGRRLVNAGEEWAIEKGCCEMGSDAEIENKKSISFHHAIGFRETERQVVFIRRIIKQTKHRA